MKLHTASGLFTRLAGMVLLAAGFFLVIMGILAGEPLDMLLKTPLRSLIGNLFIWKVGILMVFLMDMALTEAVLQSGLPPGSFLRTVQPDQPASTAG